MWFGLETQLENAKTELYLTAKLNKKFTKLEFINYLRPISKPACYNKFLEELGSGLVLDELKEIAVFDNQPIKSHINKQTEIINEFIKTANDELQVEDSTWEYYLSLIEFRKILIADVFQEYYEDDYYEKYYSPYMEKFDDLILNRQQEMDNEPAK